MMKLKNSTLRNKLRNYSVLSGSLLAASAANGQIVYTALNPPVLLNDSGQTYKLDLNGDGSNEFVFKELIGATYSKAALMFNNYPGSIVGSVVKTSGQRYGYPFELSTGYKISRSLKWFNAAAIQHPTYHLPVLAGYYEGGGINYGNWAAGATDKYVGFRVTVNTDTLYGWARCTVAPKGASMSISGYAYQSIPDSSINAGDTDVIITRIKNQPLENLNVYSFGKNVVVKYPGAARDGMTITVRDILGREIQAIQTNNEMYEFYMPDEASGIYSVTVRSKQAEVTKKVSIQ